MRWNLPNLLTLLRLVAAPGVPGGAIMAAVGILQSMLPAAAHPLIPGIVGNLKPAHIETATNRADLTSYDLFGDLTFKATDRLEFSGGVRWTRDDKTTGYSAAVLNGRSIAGSLVAVQTLGAQAQRLALAGDLAGAQRAHIDAVMQVAGFGVAAPPNGSSLVIDRPVGQVVTEIDRRDTIANRPATSIGSTARAIPGRSFGPRPGSPWFGRNGSMCISRPMACPP